MNKIPTSPGSPVMFLLRENTFCSSCLKTCWEDSSIFIQTPHHSGSFFSFTSLPLPITDISVDRQLAVFCAKSSVWLGLLRNSRVFKH